MKHRSLRSSLLILVVAAAAGCDDSSASQKGDASETDTGVTEDSGATQDSGVPEDTGAATDSGTTEDSGASDDTGAGEDTGATEDSGTTEDTGTTDDTGGTEDTAEPGDGPQAFGGRAAATACAKLFDCCDGASVERFFAPFKASDGAESDLYAALQDQIPPSATLTAEACPALLEQLYALGPWGDWIDAAVAGQVSYVASEADACLNGIAGAACGPDAAAALGLNSCLTIAPPEPGDVRTIFARTAGPRDACVPLRDGFGGLYYGSCDPSVAFCCQVVNGACAVPRADGTGTCVEASGVGEPCNYFGDLTLCQSGLICDPEQGICLEEVLPDLIAGDNCFDSGTNEFRGNCLESFCDWLGTGRCEDLKADGTDCFSSEECVSGYCDGGVCTTDTFCAASN